MNSRERVLAALNHREPDRVPVDIGSCIPTAIHVETYKRLLRLLEIDAPVEIWDEVGQLARPSEPVLEALGADVRGIRVGGAVYSPEVVEDGVLRDQWGVLWRRTDDGLRYTVAEYPLRNATRADLAKHAWPDPTSPSREPGQAERARYLKEETPYAVLGEISGHVLSRGQMLRGFDTFLMDLALQPDFADELLDRVVDIEVGIIESFLADVGPYLDVFFFKDDLGATNGPLISPDMFRRFIKPRLAKLVDAARRGTDAKICLHSDGSVYFALPDLIEIGVEVLNPVQANTKDMDTAALKREFGDALSFWGGVDTSSVLPSGTTGDVEAEVRQRIKDLGEGGGYVLTSVHNIEADVPAENVLAMARSARRYGQYPLQLD